MKITRKLGFCQELWNKQKLSLSWLLYEFPAETWLTVYRRLDKTGRKGISLSESNSKADFRQTPHFGDHRRQTILSRPHVIRNKSQAHSCFRLFLFIETGSRKHDQNKKEVSKLQLELFSILLTSAFVFVFVLLLRLYCLSLIFLFVFFIVPIVRCHALCCFTRRAWWVVCSPAFLLRCRWFCAPLDREGALRLSAPVQVSGLYFDRRAGVSTSLFQQCCVVFLVLGFLNFRSLAKFWLFHISSVALGHESCVGGQQLKFCRSMCLVS